MKNKNMISGNGKLMKGQRDGGVKERGVSHEDGMMGGLSRTDKNKMMNQKSSRSQDHRHGTHTQHLAQTPAALTRKTLAVRVTAGRT